MIRVSINRNSLGRIYGFTARNHGDSIVCAAVSALVLNAVNSIEAFTGETMAVDTPEGGAGYIRVRLPEIEAGRGGKEADLLLSSMLLGLNHIKDQYPSQIKIEDIISERSN